MTAKAILYNILGFWIHWCLVGWAGYEYLDTGSLLLAEVLFLIGAFRFTIWILELDNHLSRPVAIVFVVLVDCPINIAWSPILLLSIAGSYGEDLTFTAHCKAIRNYSLAKLSVGKKLDPVEAARFWLCEKVYGPIMNAIDPGHYH